MDKSWIWCKDKLSDEYTRGVKSFIELAKHHLDKDNKIRCPCQHCLNVYFQDINVVERHLWVKGFARNYQNWIFHGESVNVNDDCNEGGADMAEDDDEEEDDDIIPALQDAAGEVHVDVTADEDDIENQDTTNQDFSRLFEEAERELYPGCTKFSALNFLVKLMHIKALNLWSNKSFDMLLQLLNEAFPMGTRLPKSHYEAKRMLCELGLGFEKIDACKWDCALFWKESAKLDRCPVCAESRYKFHDTKGKRISQKVL